MHHTAVSSPSCLGTRPGEKTRQNPKKLEYDIIFVHDLWKSLLIPAMIVPATLIIKFRLLPSEFIKKKAFRLLGKLDT